MYRGVGTVVLENGLGSCTELSVMPKGQRKRKVRGAESNGHNTKGEFTAAFVQCALGRRGGVS